MSHALSCTHSVSWTLFSKQMGLLTQLLHICSVHSYIYEESVRNHWQRSTIANKLYLENACHPCLVQPALGRNRRYARLLIQPRKTEMWEPGMRKIPGSAGSADMVQGDGLLPRDTANQVHPAHWPVYKTIGGPVRSLSGCVLQWRCCGLPSTLCL